MKNSKRRSLRRVLSLALTVMMLLSVAPVTVSAAATYKTGDTIEFGTYPQSKVTDATVTAKLEELAGDVSGWTSYNYYDGPNKSDFMKYADVEYNGEKYRGVYFTVYRYLRPTSYNSSTTTNVAQCQNGFKVKTCYWYKYEPITWKVLSFNAATEKAVVMTESAIDSQMYMYNGTETYTRTIDGKTIYPNNYEYSEIREWLNGTFYNLAFGEAEKAAIVKTTLDNTARSATYSCSNTTDNVWLLSYSEVSKTEYGFSSDSTRRVAPTEYAKSQGASKPDDDGFIAWYLRNGGTEAGTVSCVGNSGYLYEKTDCHYTYMGTRPAMTLELHDYTAETESNDYIKTAATCTDKAVYYKFCTVCGKSSEGTVGEATFEGSALGHDFTKEVIDEAHLATAATCTAKATYYYGCSRCDKIGTDTFENGEVLAHNFGAWTPVEDTKTHTRSCEDCTFSETGNCADAEPVYTAAACTKNAYTTYTCDDCGYVWVVEDENTALTHDFTEEVIDEAHLVTEATCTAKAVYKYDCSRCDAIGEETFENGDVLGHDFTEEVIDDAHLAAEATCTAKAVYKYDCSRCDEIGEETFENGDVLGHDFTKEVIDEAHLATAATCTAKATYYYGCSRCEEIGTDTFENGEVLAHDFGAWTPVEDTKTHTRSCEDCTFSETGNCADAEPVYTAAACTKNAYTTYTCDDCGYVWVVEDENTALTHDFTEEVIDEAHLVTEATCTAKAVYKYDCSRCDTIGEDTFEYGDVLGHDFTEEVIDDAHLATAATCTAKATYYYDCSRCDEIGEETFEYGDALGHDFTAEVMSDKYLISGKTCTETDKYYKSCTRCALSSKGTEDEATFEGSDVVLGHSFTKENADIEYLKTPATCTAAAVYYKSCIRCDLSSKGMEGEDTFVYGVALDHTLTEWVVTKAATCTAEGEKTRRCENCEFVETAAVEKTAHADADKDGKCDECGGDMTSYCKHMCHSTSKFTQFFWKIIRFFQKLFKIKQECACGVKHW